jgi:serine/threonine protein kinase
MELPELPRKAAADIPLFDSSTQVTVVGGVNVPAATPAAAPQGAEGPPVGWLVQPGAEPVPGYRLVERLGQGRSSEVWKATGPGGHPVAIKFLQFGQQGLEVQAQFLESIKLLRHANLLALFGAWQAGGRLCIVMELADRTVLDRFHELVERGEPGVPAAELLDYMRDAAKGIDYLNEAHHTLAGNAGGRITHGNIKPGNLL